MQLDEFCYIKQKAAWKLIAETRFAEAGKILFQGRADPRLVIRLFPDTAGKMLQQLQVNVVPLFRGLDVPLIGDVLKMHTIDDISKPFDPPQCSYTYLRTFVRPCVPVLRV